ncbi:MAG: hypothetical protein HY822_01965 [Acidobacteria bacterium]|nr:hypothetical protein [Acidobacteriota bacterium]
MKLALGAEPKRVAILGGRVLVAAYIVFDNFRGETPAPSAPGPRAAAPAPAPAPAAIPLAPDARRPITRGTERVSQEFRPSLKPKRPEERRDPATIDPALRLELLARLKEVQLEGGQRSLFEFSQPRLPKTPDVKILPKPGTPGAKTADAPPAAGTPSIAALVKPPPPPITFKFYGFISPARGGVKRAFFLDGEDIHVAAEGELIKKRYKVVRIGVNSAVVEDTEHQHQQTLPLEEQPG